MDTTKISIQATASDGRMRPVKLLKRGKSRALMAIMSSSIRGIAESGEYILSLALILRKISGTNFFVPSPFISYKIFGNC